jgi:hypothetical protein
MSFWALIRAFSSGDSPIVFHCLTIPSTLPKLASFSPSFSPFIDPGRTTPYVNPVPSAPSLQCPSGDSENSRRSSYAAFIDELKGIGSLLVGILAVVTKRFKLISLFFIELLCHRAKHFLIRSSVHRPSPCKLLFTSALIAALICSGKSGQASIIEVKSSWSFSV